MIEFEQVDPVELADRVGTPAFVLSRGVFRERLNALRMAIEGSWPATRCFYSIKANPNPWLLREALSAGWGLDACSEGDLFLIDHVGADADSITYTGVGLSPDALGDVRSRVRFLKLDSVEDLRAIPLSHGARVGLRLSPVAPVQARAGDRLYACRKFGLTTEDVPEALTVASERGFVVEGLHCHPGSSITDVRDLSETLLGTFLSAIAAGLEHAGAWEGLRYVDVGGGIGLAYDTAGGGVSAPDYATAIGGVMRRVSSLVGSELELQIEPGEWVVSPAGSLLTRVVRVTEREGVRVAVVDASMNQYMGTSFYRPNNAITVIGAEERPLVPTDVFGRTNAPADRFCEGRELPALEVGDLLAVHCTGGYGYSRGGHFNEHPQSPEVLVSEGRFAVVREREDFGVLLTGIPAELEWLDV